MYGIHNESKFNLYFSTLTILQGLFWYFSASNWICAKL